MNFISTKKCYIKILTFILYSIYSLSEKYKQITKFTPMEKYVVSTVVSVIAGIVLFIVILINNTDKETRKPADYWWIPSSGFLLSCAVFLPLFLFIDDFAYPTQASVIKWLLFIILGISVVTWITGKIIRRKKGKL